MTRWEYREIDLLESRRSCEEQLNEEGRNGWELMHLAFDRGGFLWREPFAHAFFKRPSREHHD